MPTIFCYFGDAHNRIEAGIPPWCDVVSVPLSAVAGSLAEVSRSDANAQLCDGQKYQWIKLTLDQMKEAYAAHEKEEARGLADLQNRPAQPVRQGHPAECQCGPCKREALENWLFLRAYVGAQ